MPAAAAGYQSLRFEEDWKQICDRVGPKCRRIGETATLTLGADARMRAQYYGPNDFGIGAGDDGHVLFRSLAHGDLRIGRAVQAFVQFGVHGEAGRAGGPIGTDRSSLELQQGCDPSHDRPGIPVVNAHPADASSLGRD